MKTRSDLFTHLPRCRADTPQGTVAVAKVSCLRPTQNAVGMDEVNDKVTCMKRRSDADLQAYLIERTIPVVIGDGGHPHLIDHHHLALSVLTAEGDIDVPVEVVQNWAPVSGTHFWKAMARRHWLYPFAPDGGGPIPVAEMSKHLTDMGNDIYRSLSWVARTHYAYEKSPDNAIFAEFRWANFFRTHVVLEQMLDCDKDCASVTLADLEQDDPAKMAKARLELMYLARSPAARAMPGYLG
ncbi:MAG TPA: ParB/Srx family N-terminal domain-containing protein [Streptosporangiaceae bacterium]|nr:ParB/Srx family N-terminal domain-containing protein [Streptosporangiaceae bacterium]